MQALNCSWLLCSNVADARLLAAIDSCTIDEVPDTEVIVVCNGPHGDDVASYVRREFGQQGAISILTTPVTQLIFSLNLGLHHARGRYIARLDSDDLAYRGRLSRQFAHMEANPDVAVCGCDYHLIDEHDHVTGTVQLARSDADIRRTLTWTNPLCHPTTMLRRQAVIDVGGYLGGLHAEDYDLWVRLAQMPGLKFANLPVPGIGYRAISQGQARRARSAYASVASTQFRCFANGMGWLWGVAAASTALKGMLRGQRPAS